MSKHLYRLKRKTSIQLRDLVASFEWHFLGGKRFFSRYYPEISGSHKWCFIVGVNNSGTSLLQRILEKSGHISTLPYEGQLYTRVLNRGMKKGFERVYSEYENELIVDENATTDAGPRLVFDWMRCLKLPVKKIIVEKTPHNALRMRWLQRIFPDSCFICLVRNGYAVSEGIRRKGGKSIKRAARHWNHANKRMLEQTTGVDNWLILKYEDLVDNGPVAAGKLAELLDLDDDALHAAMEAEFSFNSAYQENASTVTNMNSRSFKALSTEDRGIISTEAGEMLSYFSYTVGTDT